MTVDVSRVGGEALRGRRGSARTYSPQTRQRYQSSEDLIMQRLRSLLPTLTLDGVLSKQPVVRPRCRRSKLEVIPPLPRTQHFLPLPQTSSPGDAAKILPYSRPGGVGIKTRPHSTSTVGSDAFYRPSGPHGAPVISFRHFTVLCAESDHTVQAPRDRFSYTSIYDISEARAKHDADLSHAGLRLHAPSLYSSSPSTRRILDVPMEHGRLYLPQKLISH